MKMTARQIVNDLEEYAQIIEDAVERLEEAMDKAESLIGQLNDNPQI